jgi:hypothetical protein
MLYLAEVITLTDGTPAMAAFDRQKAPFTESNEAGQFIFTEVPAGDYTLILDFVLHSFVLPSPSDGDLIIRVHGGQITDLGQLRYSTLPIPPGPAPAE